MSQCKAVLVISFLLAATASVADTLQYTTENGAIDGFDPVSYFSEGKPERGSPDITAEWNGAVWHFMTADHRNAFLLDPTKYAPQYGGLRRTNHAHCRPMILPDWLPAMEGV